MVVADEDHLDASDGGASVDADAYANASVDDADGADGDWNSSPLATGRAKEDRWAPRMIAQSRVYGSLVGYVKTVQWASDRNKHEAESLARAVDVALAEGYSEDSVALEMLLRRLAGVQLADQFGDWSACSATEWIPTGQSLIPRSELKQTLKDAAVMKKLMDGVARGSSLRERRRSDRRPPVPALSRLLSPHD